MGAVDCGCCLFRRRRRQRKKRRASTQPMNRQSATRMEEISSCVAVSCSASHAKRGMTVGATGGIGADGGGGGERGGGDGGGNGGGGAVWYSYVVKPNGVTVGAVRRLTPSVSERFVSGVAMRLGRIVFSRWTRCASGAMPKGRMIKAPRLTLPTERTRTSTRQCARSLERRAELGGDRGEDVAGRPRRRPARVARGGRRSRGGCG